MTDLKNTIVISLFPTKESDELKLEDEFIIIKDNGNITSDDAQYTMVNWLKKLKKKYSNIKNIFLLPYGDSIPAAEIFMVFSRVMLENNISWQTLKRYHLASLQTAKS